MKYREEYRRIKFVWLADSLVSTSMRLKTSLFHSSTAALTVLFTSQDVISESLNEQALSAEMNEIPILDRTLDDDDVPLPPHVNKAPTRSLESVAFLDFPPMFGVVKFPPLKASALAGADSNSPQKYTVNGLPSFQPPP